MNVWRGPGVGILLLAVCQGALAYDPQEQEEVVGLSVVYLQSVDQDVQGGGFEMASRIIDTPILGEVFGHWFDNDFQRAEYYSLGATFRLMPEALVAPFVGVGGSYNRRLSINEVIPLSDARPPDSHYWQGHAEAGLSVRLGARSIWMLEATYRYHWTETGGDFNYEWIGLELGQRF
jgi:hypothetical protein